MLVDEAREILGEEFAEVDDTTIEKMIESFECIATQIIDLHIKEGK